MASIWGSRPEDRYPSDIFQSRFNELRWSDLAGSRIDPGRDRIDVGEAAPYLDAALARRDWHLLLSYSDPLFADFRNLPEIQRLIAALKLPTLA